LLPKLEVLWANIATLKPAAFALSVFAIALIVGLRRFKPQWPGMLIAVAATTLLAATLQLDVTTIGSKFGAVPNSLPMPSLPAFDLQKLQAVFPDAVAIALLGSIESLLSAVVADGMSGTKHRSNCELVAQGIANIGSAAFAGMCATGTIARTATNVRSGARGPVSGILHSFYILLFMLVAAPLAFYIPLAALGGVLAVVAWYMAEKEEFISLLRASWGDAVVLMSTFLLTIFADLTLAIGVGVTLGAFLFLHRMAEAVEVEGGGHLITTDEADASGADRIAYKPPSRSSDVVVYRISGAFFFGATAAVSGALDRVGSHPKAFILDFTDVPLVDTSAAKALEGFIHKLDHSGTVIYFTGAKTPVRRTLLNAGFRPPRVRFMASVDEASAEWLRKR
jgi:SulP family sulfate permease